MAETLLKKEFREKDIQRMRNIVTKKYGNSTVSQVGYTKVSEEHAEGDIWTEDEKMWTIKDGIKQTYTKLDDIKYAIRIPMVCPSCHNRMKSNTDKKIYQIHKECSTCVAVKESKLKREGKYEEYVRSFINNNIKSHLDEAEQFLLDFANSKVSNFITEDGDIEESDGDINKKSIIEKWRKEIEEARKKLNDEQQQNS